MPRRALAPTDETESRPELRGRESVVSKLSLEYASATEEGSVEEECRKCKGREFRVRVRGLGGKEERFLACGRCGNAV
jgi:DNA-directed RNA polymerase subunit M/transcription elongation factor TFIIS